MKNIFSSPQADLQNIVQLLTTRVETMQKTILHISYQNDRIIKMLATSHQTDSANKYYQEHLDDSTGNE